MENILPLAVLALVVALFVWYVTRGYRAEKDKYRKNLEDEFLYDPATGKKYTLEEAQTTGFPAENLNRVKTDEEIEASFTDEEKEAEYARNFLRRKGYKVVENESEEEVSRFENISWWESYLEVYPDTIFRISSTSYLYFVQVTYTTTGFKGKTDTLTETQLMLWVKAPSDTQLNQLNAIRDIEYLQMRDDHFFKLSKPANSDDVDRLI